MVMEDFECEYDNCSQCYYSQCSDCCSLCFCKEHMESHRPSSSNSIINSGECGYSQNSVAPEESASTIGIGIVIESPEQKIVSTYKKGCWARPAFCNKRIQDIKTKIFENKWRCLICSKMQGRLLNKSSISTNFHQTHMDKKSKIVIFRMQE